MFLHDKNEPKSQSLRNVDLLRVKILFKVLKDPVENNNTNSVVYELRIENLSSTLCTAGLSK